MKENKLIIILLSIIIVLFLFLLLLGFGFYRYIDKSNNVSTDEPILSDDSQGSKKENETVVDKQETYISEEEAIKIACDTLKIKQQDVRDLSVELEKKYGNTVYEVDFEYNYYEYEYYINAKDGKIEKMFQSRD